MIEPPDTQEMTYRFVVHLFRQAPPIRQCGNKDALKPCLIGKPQFTILLISTVPGLCPVFVTGIS